VTKRDPLIAYIKCPVNNSPSAEIIGLQKGHEISTVKRGDFARQGDIGAAAKSRLYNVRYTVDTELSLQLGQRQPGKQSHPVLPYVTSYSTV